MNGDVVVIGGGVAGMETAGQLARTGLKVTLTEKAMETGGHLRNWHHLFPDNRKGSEVVNYLEKMIDHNNITILTGTDVIAVEKKSKTFFVKTRSGSTIEADAIVIASGFDLFKSEKKEEYGYGIYDNVITSEELESMFRKGMISTNDGNTPKKIGFIHCVGSRDEKSGNLYCSKLCCITAVKQAVEMKKQISDSRIFCFYMDMRMGGAHYEEIYRESQEKYGINYIRGKVSEVGVNINNKLVIKVEDTLAGRPLKMELDMVVLMAGMEISESGKNLAKNSGLKLGENRFFESADNYYGTNLSYLEGLFYAGSCIAPMNIPETISHARSAASEVVKYLSIGKR